MSSEPTIAELKEQIRKYELQLEQEKLKNAKQREKITTMSAEVVDSNPYRYKAADVSFLYICILKNSIYFLCKVA